MLACLRAGVPVTVVPGVTSAVGVPEAAGIPVTHRGVAQEFHVVSAHVPPGDPRSSVDWESLGKAAGTLVLLMALERIGAVAGALIRCGRKPDTPVSVIAEGTMPTQRTIYSTLEKVERQVAVAGLRPPVIVVVGGVVTVAAELAALAAELRPEESADPPPG
jgi:uroporphyrin-III C-methyltransferase/precorrin-2 dehydrogenase/sirohydrochlorin ferrochelatase